MASVKAMLGCLGIEPGGHVSVLFHLFGFARARVPADLGATEPAEVSLLQHARELGGPHIHLNVIRVGWELLPDDEREEAVARVDYAIYRMRSIYRAVGLGVGRVEHYLIGAADADGHDELANGDEVTALIDLAAFPNGGINAFVAREGLGNWSGMTPKATATCARFFEGRAGAVAGLLRVLDEVREDEGFARTFAHEIGHFLGLEHPLEDNACPADEAGRNDLMAPSSCPVDGLIEFLRPEALRRAVVLDAGQGATMRGHCSKRDGCSL